MGELTPPDWIVQKVAAGEMLDVDAGRLARKLTAMIKRSAAAEQEVSDDTENIISEFVDKVKRFRWIAALSSSSLVIPLKLFLKTYQGAWR